MIIDTILYYVCNTIETSEIRDLETKKFVTIIIYRTSVDLKFTNTPLLQSKDTC